MPGPTSHSNKRLLDNSLTRNDPILDQRKTPEHRARYISGTVARGGSRNVLAIQIESRLHERIGQAPISLATALPLGRKGSGVGKRLLELER